jgi:hypothetical protein
VSAASADAGGPRPADAAAALDRLDRLARLLDGAFRITGTGIRFGLDPLLNLLPGIGTLAAKGLSAYLVLEAARHGAPAGLLLRMAGNVGADAVLSAVPLVGWAADAVFRANARNMELLRGHLEEAAAAAATPVGDPAGAGDRGGPPRSAPGGGAGAGRLRPALELSPP